MRTLAPSLYAASLLLWLHCAPFLAAAPIIRVPAAAAGGTPSVTYQSKASDSANASTYTFSAMAIGAAVDRDYVVAGVVHRATGTGVTISSVTIGGNSATQFAGAANEQNDSGNCSSVAFYYAAVASGTTADVVVTLSSGAIRAYCAVWTVKDIGSLTPQDTATHHAASTTGAFNLDLTTPSGTSVAMGLGLVRDGGAVWTGLTKNDATTVEAITGTAATGTYSSSGTQTITCAPDVGSNALQNGVSICLQ